MRDGAISLRRSAESASIACAMLVPLGLLFLNRPYRGINGDALIYLTREIARDDPAGLGRDLMFAHDTQTGFTIFAPLIHFLLDHLTPATSSFLLASAALVAWYAGAGVLAYALARSVKESLTPSAGRVLVVLLACVAVWPLSYAPWDVLSAAEPMAVPRPFAEALALAGLGALLRGRYLAAFACALLSVAIHPLMALGGLAVAFVYLSIGDRRWLVAGVLALAALGVAGWLDVPLAQRVFLPLDADWRAVLETRTAYLFPHLWPAAYWSTLAVLAATLLLAAWAFEGPVRRLFSAVVLTGALAVAATWVLGDLYASILVVQMQLWRVVWLAATIAPMALARLALRLWPQGHPERLCLIVMLVAWICRDTPVIALTAAGGALLVQAEVSSLREKATATWVAVAAVAAGALALLWFVLPMHELVRSSLAAPPDFQLEAAYVWSLHPLAIPVTVLAVALALSVRAWTAPVAAATAVGVAIVAFALFDDRPGFQKRLDARDPPAGLLAALPPGRDPVLWLRGGKETWYWLGRPNWAAAIQGASIVFSRDLAIEWSKRAEALVGLGLEPLKLTRPWTAGPAKPGTILATPAALAEICARADAPAAIVTPLSEGQFAEPADGIVPTRVPAFLPELSAGGLEWTRIGQFAIHSCRAAASARR